MRVRLCALRDFYFFFLELLGSILLVFLSCNNLYSLRKYELGTRILSPLLISEPDFDTVLLLELHAKMNPVRARTIETDDTHRPTDRLVTKQPKQK